MIRDVTHTGISPSLEDYLEAIYWLAKEHHVARSRDIATRLDVSRSSVTGALKQLNGDGLINYDPYSYVTLTDSGMKIAKNVVRRHEVLNAFLFDVLGLPEDEADRFACAIEHHIDDTVLRKLEAFMAFVASDDADIAAWLRGIREARGE